MNDLWGVCPPDRDAHIPEGSATCKPLAWDEKNNEKHSVILTDGCAGHFGALCSPLCQETLELHYVSAELYSKHTEDEDQDVFQS